MEQNRNSRNKPMHVRSASLWRRHQEYIWGRYTVFNLRGWDSWISMCMKKKLSPYLTPYIKIDSYWIKHFNMTPHGIKNNWKTSWYWSWQWFSGCDANSIKSKSKWAYMKLKCFYPAKKTINKVKWHSTKWRKITTNFLSSNKPHT
jgi:hypothetical protein